MIQTYQQPYRPDIDGLRALAVIAVIAFHAFPTIAPGGFIGVDVFFVISGYLISGIIFNSLNEKKFSFSNFYIHRINRILPGLIILFIGCYILGWFVMMPDEYMRLGDHVVASAVFFQNIKLWHEVGYFDVAAELKPLLHLWSLSVEEQFYLFYPLLIWIAWRVRFNLLMLCLTLGIMSLAININGHIRNQYATFYLLDTRLWEILVGGIIAHLHFHNTVLFFNLIPVRTKNIFLNAFSLIGLLLIFAVFFSTNNTSKNQLLLSWITAVVGTSFLICTNTDAWINKHILANRLAVYIGLISYPLYLWHWPLLSFLRLLQRDHHISPLQKIAAVILSFVLAWMTYQWIEKPFRNGNKRKIKAASLICLLIVACLFAVYIFFEGGLASRYPEQVRRIATYSYDDRSYAKYGECWVAREPPQNKFSPRCIGALASSSSKNTILIWGDSHAAHLYPGIDELFGNQGTVAEFTRSTCPPILGLGMKFSSNYNTSDCILGNEEVFTIIKKYVPETVVLFALWEGYSDRWIAETPIAIQLLNTIHKLQSVGVKNIVLMGPAPHWNGDLPYLAFEESLHNIPLYQIPQRLNHRLKPISKILDTDLKSLVSQEKGVKYFSTLNALCNSEGCLVHTPEDSTSLTSFDYGHFTIYGARYVAKQLPLTLNNR